MKDFIIGFFKDEDGVETIEMVIILVVIVGIAVVFRKQLVNWFNSLLGQAQQQNPTDVPKINDAK